MIIIIEIMMKIKNEKLYMTDIFRILKIEF